MSTLLDYLHWRGDLTFEQSPFTEVDGLILSMLIYADLEGIVPASRRRSISLRGAAGIFFRTHKKEYFKTLFLSAKYGVSVFFHAAKTRRFGRLKLSSYINTVSPDGECQFCALTCAISRRKLAVVYSGTDETIAGWKENFNMSYMESVPAQRKAVRYLEGVAGNYREIYLAGHSKGGNLCVYAGVYAKDSVAGRIKGIYSYDGPGFREDGIDKDRYRRMIPKIRSYIPRASVVGLLMWRGERPVVVASRKQGIAQHNAVNWILEGIRFRREPHVEKRARAFERAVTAWLKKLSLEERKEFVESVFAVLKEHNIRLLRDFAKLTPDEVLGILTGARGLGQESRDIIKHFVKLLLAERGHVFREELEGLAPKIFGMGKKEQEAK